MLLTVLHSLWNRNVQRIVEYPAGVLKIHVVLSLVREILCLIPLEAEA